MDEDLTRCSAERIDLELALQGSLRSLLIIINVRS
jgi:hypothetical protein